MLQIGTVYYDQAYAAYVKDVIEVACNVTVDVRYYDERYTLWVSSENATRWEALDTIAHKFAMMEGK